MHLMQAPRLITAILPRGVALPLLPRIKDELGVLTAHLGSARGSGRSVQGAADAAQSEKDLLTIVASAEQAPAVFAWLHEEARIDRPGGGLLFQLELGRATVFRLPSDVAPEQTRR